MGTVVSLTLYRAAKQARQRVRAAAARQHPALRYLTAAEAVSGTVTVGHARAAEGTACGLPGPLRLATFYALPECPDCFPPGAS